MEKTILIVDDFDSTRNITKFTLQKAGYRVIEAANGLEALKHLNGGAIHLIITDLNMPKMDGLAFSSEVRSTPRYRYTPILMLTTEAKAMRKEDTRVADLTGWITKPFTVESFLNTIQKVLR